MKEGVPEKPEVAASSLVTELLQMFEVDQNLRKSSGKFAEVDIKNTARMKEILAASGWPTISKVGDKAAHAAWLLVQHADRDPSFQRECLDLMKTLPEGEVDPRDVAFLEDRVRVKEGRPTLYGTQFTEDSEGNFGPEPIEDPELLNERRKAVGLGTFEEYVQEMPEINSDNEEE